MKSPSLRCRVVIGISIFLLAFGVRVLSWHDTRLEVGKVQTAVTADYHRLAQLLSDGGMRSFFSSSLPHANLNNLGHPPGYSILLALTHKMFGQSDTAAQFVQITADAFAAVMILLIVAELMPFSAAALAGLLAALSPQFSWNSVLLLPDSICVLPILIAIHLAARGAKRPRFWIFLIAGALIGVSCWLRANAMLLTLFVGAAVLLLMLERKRASRTLATRPKATPADKKTSAGDPSDPGAPNAGAPVWRFALAVIAGTLLVVLPLTIRNAIVFHRFIPVSLGAGQTLLEGIADYDTQGRFGVPATDVGIMKQEAELYQRPDYYDRLFAPDGVERERARLSRGLAIIKAHPFWFAGVMAKRASSMMRLERARLISTQPAITHTIGSDSIVSTFDPDALVSQTIDMSPGAKITAAPDAQEITMTGDASRYGVQATWPLALRPKTDYIAEVPVKIERGRIRISIIGSANETLSTAIVETIAELSSEQQPSNVIQLPFESGKSELRVAISNEASQSNPVVKIGAVKLYELGPARLLWTRYPRFVIHGIQKLFITAVMLPLGIIGLLIVIFRKQSAALVILSVVPVYFFTVQSAVHTEYRYVLAVDYFMFAFAGVAIAAIVTRAIAKLRS